ncbi:uncharacterized protein LOC135843356 isoform X2 [Planococcus citri]|uniref:uncharacterized protein LOC135843356 isoform X2 n=1 Tax=Planococcus citri TaxID=170843 RepID=UPI0031F99560
MNLLNSFSKEESARRGQDIIGFSPSHQFSNNFLKKFREDDAKRHCEPESLTHTSVPTLQPKLKHGSTPSINNSNTITDVSNKQFRRKFGDITNNYDDDVPTKGKKLALKRKLKVKQSRQRTTKCFRSEIFKLRTRCSRLEDTVADLKKKFERQDENVVPAKIIDRNVAEDTCDRGLTIYSSEKSKDSSCNTEALPEKHYEKVAFVKPVEKVAKDEDGYSTDSSMPPLEVSNDDLRSLEEPLEQFSEEGCSQYLAQVAHSETSRNITEDNRGSSTASSAENSGSSPCSTETPTRIDQLLSKKFMEEHIVKIGKSKLTLQELHDECAKINLKLVLKAGKGNEAVFKSLKKVPKPKNFVCDYCEEANFKEGNALSCHYQTHKTDGFAKYVVQCSFCVAKPIIGLTNEHVESHIKNQHRQMSATARARVRDRLHKLALSKQKLKRPD